MNARTLNITIYREPKAVYEFASNPENLPKWAAMFCRSVRQEQGRWIVETPQGPVTIRFAPKNEYGILDHYVSPAPGVELYVPMRVVPNGSGSEIVFTLFQTLDLSDADFAEQLRRVERDLNGLKRALEA